MKKGVIPKEDVRAIRQKLTGLVALLLNVQDMGVGETFLVYFDQIPPLCLYDLGFFPKFVTFLTAPFSSLFLWRRLQWRINGMDECIDLLITLFDNPVGLYIVLR